MFYICSNHLNFAHKISSGQNRSTCSDRTIFEQPPKILGKELLGVIVIDSHINKSAHIIVVKPINSVVLISAKLMHRIITPAGNLGNTRQNFVTICIFLESLDFSAKAIVPKAQRETHIPPVKKKDNAYMEGASTASSVDDNVLDLSFNGNKCSWCFFVNCVSSSIQSPAESAARIRPAIKGI